MGALISFVLAAPVLACAVYLAVLAIAARRAGENFSLPPSPRPAGRGERAECGQTTPPPSGRGLGGGKNSSLRFDIIVPAHDEESGIAATVRSLLSVDYPTDLRRVIVVADNCGDATSSRAREAGARVLERNDPSRRGKGYALSLAFERSLEEAFADAVIVVDADTTVSPNLLSAFARAFEDGARVVQADYGVRNPDDSWRTRLMAIALSLFHVLRSLGRERLELSCGLRGNGMGFALPVLREVPHRAVGLVEDVEHGIALGRAGYRVHFVGDAHVYGEMVAKEEASRSQRRRWEQGRKELARSVAPPLLREAIATRDRVLFDLALDLLVPPLSTLVLATLFGLALSIAIVALGASKLALAPWIAAATLLVLYVARGWQLSGAGVRGLFALAWAPVYVVWKVGLALTERVSHDWVRTQRQGGSR